MIQRQWYLLTIAVLLSAMSMKNINAHSDHGDDDIEEFDIEAFKKIYDDYDGNDDFFDKEDQKEHYHNMHNHDDEGHCITSTLISQTTSSSSVAESSVETPKPRLGITPTDAQIGPRICEDVLPDEAFFRFTAIFFGDFYTFGGNDILGPLAVKGAFHAPDYVVNANRGQDCSDKDSLNSYGLVVGGPLDTKNTQVHGAVYVAGSGDLTQIKGLENDCEVTNKKRTGLVDFIDLEKKATDYNIRLAAQPPTLQLNADNQVVRLGPTRGGMEFITFNSCNPSSLCENIWPNAMSNPNSVLFGQGNWNGVQGPQPDPGITYVFNIPVVETTTITLNTNNPTQGFNGCRTILNFYPVKATGGAGYGQYSAFTIVRNTGSPINGLILAPKGNIRDGPIGNFDGSIIARSYTWAFTNGVEIHDYRAGGANCDVFEGCTPFKVKPIDPDSIITLPSDCSTNAVYDTVITQNITVTNEITVTDKTTEIFTFTKDQTITESLVSVAQFTTTVANTVTFDHTTTVDNVILVDVTTTKNRNITEKTTTTESVTTTRPGITLTTTLATTTTKTNIAAIATLSDTTYTEMNTETVTLLLPTTIVSLATETEVNVLYDTSTLLMTEVTTLSTYTETDCDSNSSQSSHTPFIRNPHPDLTDSGSHTHSASTNVPTNNPEPQQTHIHDANCGHKYEEEDKKYQKDKYEDDDDKYDDGEDDKDNDEDDKDDDKDYEKDD